MSPFEQRTCTRQALAIVYTETIQSTHPALFQSPVLNGILITDQGLVILPM